MTTALARLIMTLFVFCLCSANAYAETKPNLVLLPLEVSEADIKLESEYGSALQSGLKERYKVFYGAAVERELEKEYSKIDCDAEQCNQNVALAFNGELVADASVKKITGGYVLKLVIKNVLTNEVLESPAIPCEGCNSFAVIRQLKKIGAGDAQEISNTSQRTVASVSAAKVQTDSRAILIFDSQPSGAEVYINNKKVGRTPYQGLNHQLGGQLSVEIKDPDHRPYQMKVTLSQAITQLEPVKLEAGQAFLTIVTEPFDSNALVYINGQAKGKAPLQAEVSTKTLEIYAQSGSRKTAVQSIKLADGQNEQLRLLFESQLAQQLGINMVDIPSGSFQMGSNIRTFEKPIHRVTVDSFKMMATEVTKAQFARFVAKTSYQTIAEKNVNGKSGCVTGEKGEWERRAGRSWKNTGFEQGDKQPVVCISFQDAQAFILWVNEKTRQNYRLPSEAEWEYAARSGLATKYSWGNEIGRNKANCNGCGSRWDNLSTAPVASFQANSFGLFDMHGNASELVQDCWNDYIDASGRNSTQKSGDCNERVTRSGSWVGTPKGVRSAYRIWWGVTYPANSVGFRLAMDK